jgi:hypothetical protein
MKNIYCLKHICVLLFMLCAYFNAQSQTTYNFDSGSSISIPPGGTWNTLALVTIGGINYKLTSFGNGGFSNSSTNGSGNSASLQKDGSGGDTFVLERADGLPFTFYSMFVRQESISSYASSFPGIPPWYTVTYNKTVGAAETEEDNTPVSGGTYTTGTRNLSRTLVVTSVSIFFQANSRYWVDDIRVGIAAGTEVPPTVTTTAAAAITSNSATLGGNVTADGGANVTERGIVWGTTANPTTSGNKVTIGSGTGAFSNTVSSLPVNTLINFRAYAINSEGTNYGGNTTFTTLAPTITVSPATVPGATVGVAYSQTFTGSGGTAPYTFTVSAGALPAGLSLNTTSGALSGTPSAAGTFNFTIRSTDAAGGGGPYSGTRAYTLVVGAPTILLPATTLADGNAGTAYSQTLNPASGGVAPYSYALTAGALPPGLTLSIAGALNGTPTGSGTFNFAITATDASTGSGPYSSAPRGFTLTVNVPIVISPATLPDIAYAVPYNQALNSSGGTAPYSYSLTAGALPIGISFNSSGVFSGIPRSDGNFSLTVRSEDANGLAVSKVYTFTVSAPAIAISPLTLPDPVLGVAYNQSLSSTGGIAPYSYSLVSGALPVGISFNSAGVLSGTPQSAGTFNFVVRSTDDAGANISQAYTLTIATPTLVIAPAALPDAAAGTAYSQTLTTTGGIAPYSYLLTAGALPIGVSFNSAGVFSGTPTVKGMYNLTVRTTDASSGTGPYSIDKIYSITVQGKAQAITMAGAATVSYGDADFDPGATSDSGLPVSYSTSNPAIATIVAGKVHLIGTGQVTVFANQAGNGVFNAATQQQQTLTINKAQLSYVANSATKIYGSANPALSGTITGFKYSDNLAGATTGTVAFTSTATATSGAGSYPITGSGLTATNYTFVQAAANATALTISPKALTITADNKEKFAGAANPVFTASYSGFITGESQTVLTAQPVFTTTANTGSGVGTYDINVSGAAAANYAISYVKGVLTVKPGAPTDISLAAVTLYENSTAGTNAGTLSSVSADPSATFTYTLVAGAGDTDNALFAISTNRLNTAAGLNFENKATYSLRVRSTTQYGLSFDKVLNISVADVNEAPTLATIVNLPVCSTNAAQTVALTGISAGPETAQTTAVSVSSNNAALFESLIASSSGATGSVNYRIKSGAVGTATVTVTVKDNGGTANNGVDTYSQTFVITVNPLPVLSVSSDKGNSISKGEVILLTATGANNYAWTGSNGIISGGNSAVLTIRPTTTTTYTVTGTNASGCSRFLYRWVGDDLVNYALNLLNDEINKVYFGRDTFRYHHEQIGSGILVPHTGNVQVSIFPYVRDHRNCGSAWRNRRMAD